MVELVELDGVMQGCAVIAESAAIVGKFYDDINVVNGVTENWTVCLRMTL